MFAAFNAFILTGTAATHAKRLRAGLEGPDPDFDLRVAGWSQLWPAFVDRRSDRDLLANLVGFALDFFPDEIADGASADDLWMALYSAVLFARTHKPAELRGAIRARELYRKAELARTMTTAP